MAVRKPVLIVNGPGGANILPGLGNLWLSVTVTDKAGSESDTARILCVGPPGRIDLPERGAIYEILMGWEDEGPVLQGRFAYQKVRATGAPGQGETVELQLRSADYSAKLKKHARKHHDATTFGNLMKKVAKEAGLEAEVDPDLAKIKLDYALQWDQSLIDFANEEAARLGATVKPAGGKLVAMKRGGSSSASGRALEPIRISRADVLSSPTMSYSVEIDPRPEVGQVAASHRDAKTGKRKIVKKSAGREGQTKILPHPYRSEDEAGLAAEAEIYDSLNASGSGEFVLAGRPRARAEAPVEVSGFGPGIDGSWKCESVVKTVDRRSGFMTTVNVTAGKDAKGKKGGKAK